jgi:hypothetical protein
MRHMTKRAPAKKTPLKGVSLKLPANLWDEANRMGDHVRGGASEVLRRAIKAGLPMVRVQSHINPNDQ